MIKVSCIGFPSFWNKFKEWNKAEFYCLCIEVFFGWSFPFETTNISKLNRDLWLDYG